jgi:hypothetical protein
MNASGNTEDTVSNMRALFSIEGFTLLLAIGVGGGGAGALGADFGDGVSAFLGGGPSARAVGALPVLVMISLGMYCGILAWTWVGSRVGFDQAKVRRLIGKRSRGEKEANTRPPAA